MKLKLLFILITVLTIALCIGMFLIINEISKERNINFNHLDEDYKNAISALNNREYDKCIKLLSKYLSTYPNDAHAYYFRGRANLQLGNYTYAVENFSKAIELQPDSLIYYENRAEAYLLNQSYQDAIKDIQLIKQKMNETAEISEILGEAYYNIGIDEVNNKRYKEAIEYSSKAIEQNPKKAKYYFLRGCAYEFLKQYELAIEDLKQAIYLDPTISDYYTEISQCYFELKNYNKAIDYLNTSIELNSKNHWAYYLIGLCYYKKGNLQKALLNFTNAYNIKNNKDEYIYARGNVHLKLKMYDKAISDYNIALSLNPSNANAYFNRGMAFLSKSDFDRAKSDLKQAKKLDPSLSKEVNSILNSLP
ncbi:MAG: tetratricopeptide repeat protein [Ignavibacteria bacterium]|nr:tetratricopeptide repeat protein [Ignavibacteria bacterium]